MTEQEINGALAVVQEVLRRLKPLILERAGKSSFTDKHDGSPVTETDVEIEKTLQAEMARRCPQAPVFGEETGYSDELPAAFWLVDPIDGTKSFIENTPTFTNMAVLIQNGEAVACVIYNPSTDDMYVAQKGKGAYKNGARLHLAAVPLPAVAYSKARFFDALDSMLKPAGVHCENGPEGGGFGFTMVADGRSAARFNLLGRGNTHDYAPGALLVREAGGAILPVKEDAYTYKVRSFIACHPQLEAVLGPHLKEIRELEIQLADK